MGQKLGNIRTSEPHETSDRRLPRLQLFPNPVFLHVRSRTPEFLSNRQPSIRPISLISSNRKNATMLVNSSCNPNFAPQWGLVSEGRRERLLKKQDMRINTLLGGAEAEG